MKRLLRFILIATISVLSLSSCASILPARFDSFANNVERNGENYTLRKWEKKNAKFKSLCAEYKDNFSKYTRTERRRIHGDIMTYAKTAAKTGAITVTDMVSEVAEEITEMVQEAKEFLDSLKKKD